MEIRPVNIVRSNFMIYFRNMRQYVAVVLAKYDGSVLAQHRDTKDDKPNILGPNTWCAVGGARDGENDIEREK